MKMSSTSEYEVPFVSQLIMAIQGTTVGGCSRRLSLKWIRTPCTPEVEDTCQTLGRGFSGVRSGDEGCTSSAQKGTHLVIACPGHDSRDISIVPVGIERFGPKLPTNVRAARDAEGERNTSDPCSASHRITKESAFDGRNGGELT